MEKRRSAGGRHRLRGAADQLHYGEGARQAHRRQPERRHQAGGAGAAPAGRPADDPEESAGLPARADSSMMRSRWIWLATLALSAAPAVAQSPSVAMAIQAGQVGERYDGYMGYVGNPSPELRRQVSAIN